MNIHSYPSIYNIGHKLILDIFEDDVLIEEKIDGSQFSMLLDADGLHMRSKGAEIFADVPEKMFSKAVETAKNLDLHHGWIYRCEFLLKPKHNTLCYERVPKKNLILFDINVGDEIYLSYDEKMAEAERLGLEVVPIIYYGKIDNVEALKTMLNRISILGGTNIEGIVVKNYNKFTPDKKAMFGKFVSEKFKEVHGGEWRKNNPTGKDIVNNLILQYRTPARWMKAIQHLRDAGILEQSPRDIGNLIREIQEDTKKECEEEIKDKLFNYFWKNISRGITKGVPEWYKEELLKLSFEDKGEV